MNQRENTDAILKGLKAILPQQILHQSQRDVFLQYLENPEKPQTGIFDLATGFGKTRMMSVLIMAYFHQIPDGKVIIVVPTQDLVKEQPTKINDYISEVCKIDDGFMTELLMKFDIGLFYGIQTKEEKEKSIKKPVILTTYNSLENLEGRICAENVGLLLLDEAHHAVSPARMNTIRGFVNAAQYGMTATPWYSESKNLNTLLKNTIAHVSAAQSIRDGDLANCKNILMVSNFKVDLSNIKKNTSGDYDDQEYNAALIKAMKGRISNQISTDTWEEVHTEIARSVAEVYKTYKDKDVGQINQKSCMINCRSQKEAEIQARELNELFGYHIAGVWTSDHTDETVYNAFKEGKLQVICQVARLGEGFDMPRLGVEINYPTCSWVREAQLIGRVLRKGEDPNKTALVIDLAFQNPHADNIVEAIHLNGQILCQDILGDVYICQNSDEKEQIERKEKTKNKNEVSENMGMHIPLENFTVISDIKKLTLLSKEAKLVEETKSLPPKREGQMPVTEISKKYHIPVDDINNILIELIGKEVKNEQGKLIPAVELVCSRGANKCGCLVLNPEAVELFERQNNIPPMKCKGQMSISELAEKYDIDKQTVLKIIDNMIGKTVQNSNGENIDIIKIVRQQGAVNGLVVLSEDPVAICFFEKKANLEICQKEPGMMTVDEIITNYNKYKYKPTLVKKALICMLDETIVDGEGKDVAVVRRVQTENGVSFALNNGIKPFLLFQKEYNRLKQSSSGSRVKRSSSCEQVKIYSFAGKDIL